MFKVKSQSLINSWTHSFTCETELEANEWIEKQTSKKLHWGRFKGEREVFVKGQGHPKEEDYNESLVRVGSQYFWTDEEGDSWAKVILEQEYSFEIINLLQDPAYVKEQRIKNKKELGATVSFFTKEVEAYLIGHLTEIDATDEEVELTIAEFTDVYDAIKKRKPKKLKKEVGKIETSVIITEEVKADLIYILKDI